MPHICVGSLEGHSGCGVIFVVRHSMNYNHESGIWQLCDVTSWFLPACSPKSVAGWLLPPLPFFLASWTTLAHFFKKPSTQYRWMHSALSKFSKCSQVSELSRKSATVISQRRGSSRNCFKRNCPGIMDQCIFPKNPPTHTSFHLLKALKLCYPILLANCFKENSVCFKVIVTLPSAPHKSDESSLSVSASNSSEEISGNWGKSTIPVTSVLHNSTASWNRFIGKLMRGLPGAPGIRTYGVEENDVGWFTGLLPAVAGGTWGVPGNDGPCPVNCQGGNIWGPP